MNINVDSEVTKYIANLQRQANITDPDKFHEYVRQQAGMSYEDFLAETKNQYLTREVIGQEVARHAGIERVVLLSCADVSLINGDRVHWKENATLAQAPLGVDHSGDHHRRHERDLCRGHYRRAQRADPVAHQQLRVAIVFYQPHSSRLHRPRAPPAEGSDAQVPRG